jgi:CRP-like cAMP-binding protein
MIAEQLKSCALLAGFDAGEIDALVKTARERRAEAGQALLRMGEPNSAIHVIVSGAVKITRIGAEGELLLSTLKAGQTFGEMSFIDASRTGAAVVATEPTLILEIGRESVDALAESNPKATAKLWRNVALDLRRRLARSNEVVEHLTDINQILTDPSLRDHYSQT